jgi:hypothetical protein
LFPGEHRETANDVNNCTASDVTSSPKISKEGAALNDLSSSDKSTLASLTIGQLIGQQTAIIRKALFTMYMCFY